MTKTSKVLGEITNDGTEFSGLGRSILIATIVTLRARIKELESGNLILKGWKCDCGIFNGEERSELIECRVCGRGKHNTDIICSG